MRRPSSEVAAAIKAVLIAALTITAIVVVGRWFGQDIEVAKLPRTLDLPALQKYFAPQEPPTR